MKFHSPYIASTVSEWEAEANRVEVKKEYRDAFSDIMFGTLAAVFAVIGLSADKIAELLYAWVM